MRVEKNIIKALSAVKGIENLKGICIVYVDSNSDVKTVSKGPIELIAESLLIAHKKQKSKVN